MNMQLLPQNWDSFLPESEMDVVFGGGGIGLMGKLADAVLENGGTITGVIPSFMKDEGWDHSDVNEMIVTPRYGRKKKENVCNGRCCCCTSRRSRNT